MNLDQYDFHYTIKIMFQWQNYQNFTKRRIQVLKNEHLCYENC